MGRWSTRVDLHAKAWQDAFRDFGHDVELEAIRGQIGKGGDQLMPVFLSQAEIDGKGKDLEAHRARILKERYLPQIEGFPKVRELFERIIARTAAHRPCLIGQERGVADLQGAGRIGDLVDIETSSDDAEKSKPHGDIFEAALERLGHPPARGCDRGRRHALRCRGRRQGGAAHGRAA